MAITVTYALIAFLAGFFFGNYAQSQIDAKL
jgi:hypothetical protein